MTDVKAAEEQARDLASQVPPQIDPKLIETK